MTYPKMIQLVEDLSQLTDDNALDWAKTSEPDVFQVAFANYSIQVYPKHMRGEYEDSVDIHLDIIDTEGTVIDGVSDRDLYGVGSSKAEDLGRLWAAARRRAMGVDVALDNILGELRKKKDIPF